MRWNADKEKTVFAFLPTRVEDRIVWLERYILKISIIGKYINYYEYRRLIEDPNLTH